jgi:hypothetical protein
MNTPRQPNARTGTTPFLGQNHNADTSATPARSFVAPLLSEKSTKTPEITGNVTGDRSATRSRIQASLNES